MKIIIIGSGIAGLSAYVFLHKHLQREHPNGYQIKIYEAYDIRRMGFDAPKEEQPQAASQAKAEDPLFTQRIIGGALGLGKNGLAVLGRMDEDGTILKQIQRRGNCVSKWRIGSARGWLFVDANVQGLGKEDEGKGANQQAVDSVMIVRQAVWEVLRDAVLDIDPDAVAIRKVSEIQQTDSGQVSVVFSDGSSDQCDILVGADGLRSIVRTTIFAKCEDTEPQSRLDWILRRQPKRKDYITPHYEGLVGVAGFVPASVLADTGHEQDIMRISFGPNGFFGHGYLGPAANTRRHNDAVSDPSAMSSDGLAGWWSTFSSEIPYPYQKKDTSDPAGIKTTFDKDHALADLLSRHKSWKDPTIQAILRYVEKTNDILEHVYPTYTTPELPTWHSSENGNMVLIGDAAHALQPSSGQGACQAMEDAEALALFLKHHLCSQRHAPTSDEDKNKRVKLALRGYEELRMPRVAIIYKQSQKMSRRKMDMGFVMEMVMYAAIWVSMKLHTWKNYNDALFEYDLPASVTDYVRQKEDRTDVGQ